MEDVFWHRIGQLWDVATGGTEVASRPTSPDSSLPQAASVPGLDEARDWFTSTLGAPVHRYLFLVGGPGAGKSHVTRSIVKTMDPLDARSDELAYRKYQYRSGKQTVTLINDATIPSDEFLEQPLVHEIDESVGHSNFIACVNRGILVEEMREQDGRRGDTAGMAVVRWLDGDRSYESNRLGAPIRIVTTHEGSSYVKTGELYLEDSLMGEIVAVYVDVCSLFELRPSIVVDSEGDWSPEPYRISSVQARRGWTDDKTIAGSLLKRVIDFLSGEAPESSPDATANPVLANLEDLKALEIRRHWLSTLRAAEIASGQKFTYRELWGAIVRSVVGDMPSQIQRQDIKAHLLKLVAKVEEAGLGSLDAVAALGDLRIHQSLFPSGQTSIARGIRNPVLDRTGLVDPMRDARPGTDHRNSGEGWFSPVSDALSGATDGKSPLALLYSQPESQLSGSRPSEFDVRVDDWFTSTILPTKGSKTKSQIGRMRSWYSRYLGRKYALHNGVTGFSDETQIWMEACQLSPTLPDRLKRGLEVLIRPHRDPRDISSPTLIPVLDSRAAPIVGALDRPKLAGRLSDFRMTTGRDGELLELLLSENEDVKAVMVLDFPLVREALTAGEIEPGVTELSETTVPRLERFRSTRLEPEALKHLQYELVLRHDEKQLSIQPK